MPGTDDAMSWRHDIHDGLSTLAVLGSLTQASGQVLYDVLVDVVQRRPAVLIDVSALTITDREAMTVFTRIMAVAVQWPDVMVLICGPRDRRPAPARGRHFGSKAFVRQSRRWPLGCTGQGGTGD